MVPEIPQELRFAIAKAACDAYNRHWYYRFNPNRRPEVIKRYLRIKGK